MESMNVTWYPPTTAAHKKLVGWLGCWQISLNRLRLLVFAPNTIVVGHISFCKEKSLQNITPLCS